ncbi:MAG: ABC transporter ATP-binding protein [Rhizobiaceae bacterium]|nr:ABC transporter ATP-binding protein [Rhizobiaceae bacterium]
MSGTTATTDGSAGEAQAPLLELRGLSIDFMTERGLVRSVRDVSFSVEAGRIVGVVGESGSGKTTAASSVLRLLSANATVRAGEIRFQSADILRLGESELRDLRGRDIAMVFQDPMTALNPLLTVGAQMSHAQHRETRLSKREKRARAADMLAKVGIADAAARLDAYPHAFSGGMRQRVAIAMALLGTPRLLIADEPTTALDATTEMQIVALLRQLQREIGSAILFISHSLALVSQLCDDVVVMYAGTVVEQGVAEAIFAQPQHPYTRALLAADPSFLPEVTRDLPTIAGEVPDLLHVPPGCVFAPRCAVATARCLEEDPSPRRGPSGAIARCHAVPEAAA